MVMMFVGFISMSICFNIYNQLMQPYKKLLNIAVMNDRIRHEEKVRHSERQRLENENKNDSENINNIYEEDIEGTDQRF